MPPAPSQTLRDTPPGEASYECLSILDNFWRRLHFDGDFYEQLDKLPVFRVGSFFTLRVG
jgi:hypothetical protein